MNIKQQALNIERRKQAGSVACSLTRRVPHFLVLSIAARVLFSVLMGAAPSRPAYLDFRFENGSPLFWEIEDDGTVQVFLVYDHERDSVNRANGHWFFRVLNAPSTGLRLVLNHFDNIYNGRLGSPVSDRTICFTSVDGTHWQPREMELLPHNRLALDLPPAADGMYVARLEPYRIRDLDRFLAGIRTHPDVQIQTIGSTVEGRSLEIVQVGRTDAPHRVLLRARAHPWEPGGNWVVQGLVRRLLREDETARRYRERYCVSILPMANKDGVARGRTRFNLQGMDLNRNWDRPADPELAPENHALEKWLEDEIASGRRPDLAIDFHNDEGGLLHLSRPEEGGERYLDRMRRLEKLLREHTWFTEGTTGSGFRNPGTFGEGLLARYGIDAVIHELNANRIEGLQEPPSSRHWEEYGGQLAEVFHLYFN